MKNILLATDLATVTNRAFERAVKLASTSGAKLHILHLCPLYSFSKKKKQKISLKQDAEDMIKNSLDACKGVKKLNTTITVIEGGETFAEIINHAEKIKAGLIVMGMHGKVKLRDMFVGTTIERVIRKGVKPVLMVRDKPLGDYKSVLVGTDFSEGSKRVFHIALELAPSSLFHLVHTYGFPNIDIGDYLIHNSQQLMKDLADNRLEKYIKENKKILKRHKIGPENFNYRTVEGDTYASLLREAAKVKSDLIAIGTHSHVSLMPYKLGGTARDILSSPPCDVLISKGL
ncbi:MAG: universal stress protein [Desulfobulbaceae bacterium]|nr:universal stress protein [Desulfobulbaceae bacterium]